MTASPGEEFRIKAAPTQEQLRRLLYLGTQDNDSVLTGGIRSHRIAYGSASDKAAKAADALTMARLADPAYQALSAQINATLDLMDEASVHALQEIEAELLELRQQRERMLEQAYRDEQGRAIFMTADESAAYYENGAQVEEDEFARQKELLRGRPTWDGFTQLRDRERGLSAERDQIHKHDADRERLREDLAEGNITKEEAEQREREIEQAMPERMKPHYARLRDPQTDAAATPPAELRADELARVDARSAPEPDNQTVTPTAPPPMP